MLDQKFGRTCYINIPWLDECTDYEVLLMSTLKLEELDMLTKGCCVSSWPPKEMLDYDMIEETISKSQDCHVMGGRHYFQRVGEVWSSKIRKGTSKKRKGLLTCGRWWSKWRYWLDLEMQSNLIHTQRLLEFPQEEVSYT